MNLKDGLTQNEKNEPINRIKPTLDSESHQ